MALEYGFYPTSESGQTRNYTDDDIGGLFDGLINDGVYMAIGDRFSVKPYNGSNIQVGTGRAWFKHTYNYLKERLIFAIPQNSAVEVVLVVNKRTFTNSIEVKQVGYDSGDHPDIYYLKLARVIRIGSNNITTSDITSYVGSYICPYVTGIIQTMTIDEITANWRSQFQSMITSMNGAFNGQMSSLSRQWNEFMASRNKEDQDYQEKLNDFYASLESTSEKYIADANHILEEKGEQLAQLKNSYVTQLENVTSEWNSFFEESQNQIQNLIDSTGTTVNKVAKEEVQNWTDEWGLVYMQQHIEEMKSQYTLLPLKSKVLDENGYEIVDEDGNPITAMNHVLVI